MADNYQKIGKFYTLTGMTPITITGASFLHGLYNGTNGVATVVVDSTHLLHIPNDDGITFPVPVPFSTVRMNALNTTGVILYS
jgi:hypothetical protein